MLRGVAADNVKAWHFAPLDADAAQAYGVTFHFLLEPPQSGYHEDGPPVTRTELDGKGGVRVISTSLGGLSRSGCPTAAESVLPAGVIGGDFVEVDRWNETVRVDADGAVRWSERHQLGEPKAHIGVAEARALLEKFRTQAAWSLCGSYSEDGLMDGGGSSFKVRIGGQEKSADEYGDSAPPLFDELEIAVDAAADTHRWRHGDPAKESIIEIDHEYLPKPGKTKLMDAAARGDKAAMQAAFAAGEKVTDVDTSGWTPLMYAAGSYGASGEAEMLAAGADVNARSKRGETVLMAAAAEGDTDEDLIKAGANVNASNDFGMTALMLLAQRGGPDDIAIMLKAGADARRKDKMGRTALDYLNAASCGRAIIAPKDPPGPMTGVVGYSRCNALGDGSRTSKKELSAAGAVATRAWTPRR
jgi:hypothetical protein